MNKQPAVLVVGDNDLAGLQVVRSLGRAGLRVELVSYLAQAITRSSKYVAACHRVEHPLTTPSQFGARILDLISNRRFRLVIPTTDESLATLMAIRGDCEQHARIAAPDQNGFNVTSHKEQTLRLAKELEIPVPISQIMRRPSDIDDLHRWQTFPLVLKPSCSISKGTSERNTVTVVPGPDEASQYVPEMLKHGPVLVQEYCPGRGVGLSALGDRGKIVAAFQHRRLHEPPRGGASSYRVSEPLDKRLLEYAAGFCRKLAWTGPIMFEYRHDHNVDSYTLMEVNGRLWGSVALAIHAGVDFPLLLYQLFTQGCVDSVFEYRVPCFVRHTTRDLYWFQANLRAPRGQQDIIKVRASSLAKEALNIVTLRERYDLESWRDPLPAITAWACLARRVVTDVAEKLHTFGDRGRFSLLVRQLRRQAFATRDRLSKASSILFVCTGNINRSAVAERHFADAIKARGIRMHVASAGVSAVGGRPADRISREVAQECGVDLEGHVSARLTTDMLRRFDRIVVMDAHHLCEVLRLAPDVADQLLPLAAFDPTEDTSEIGDPFGKNRDAFRSTYTRIIRCVDKLAADVSGSSSSQASLQPRLHTVDMAAC